MYGIEGHGEWYHLKHTTLIFARNLMFGMWSLHINMVGCCGTTFGRGMRKLNPIMFGKLVEAFKHKTLLGINFGSGHGLSLTTD